MTSGKICEIRARLDQRQATAKERHDARGVTYLAELSPGRSVEKCLQPRSYKVESASGSVLRRNRRDIRETAADDDEHEQPSSTPRPTTVEPPTGSLTAEPVEPLVTRSVEPVQEPVGSPIRKDSVKRVRFQVEQKGYHTRSGRLSKPPHRGNV